MEHTALYRKWRSKTFDEISGQEYITEALRNQVKSGKIAHAYLFSGTRGTGKTSAAKILARAVNCESPVNGNPCNSCPVCLKILRDSCMEVQELDAASNNGVDDIRKLRDQIQYPPHETKYKVYIIDEVHMLSQSAFNAFLKTLEEPPEYVIFILATTEPNKIPITILSRCQKYDFRRISTEKIYQRLREIAENEGIVSDDKALYYIARRGDGSMRDAISLLDQVKAVLYKESLSYEKVLEILGTNDVSFYSELVRAMTGRNTGHVLDLVSKMVDTGRDLGQFVDDLILYVRNMLVASETDDLRNLVDMSDEDLKILKRDAGIFTKNEKLRYIRRLSELSNSLKYTIKKRVPIEIELMKLSDPETEVSEEGIYARMEEIGRLLKEGAEILPGDKDGKKKEKTEKADAETDKEKGKETVVLPRARLEELKTLRAEWTDIVKKINIDGVRPALMSSFVFPEPESSSMRIALDSKGKFRLVNTEEVLNALKEEAGKRYGREIIFHPVLTEMKEESVLYITDEDLSKINMDIEEE